MSLPTPAEAQRWAAQFEPYADLRKQRHTESATYSWTVGGPLVQIEAQPDPLAIVILNRT